MNPWIIAGVVGAVGVGGFVLYKKGQSVSAAESEAAQESSGGGSAFSNPALLYSPPSVSSGGAGGGGGIAGSGAPGLPTAQQIVAAATGQQAPAGSGGATTQVPTSPVNINPNPGIYASNNPLQSSTAFAEVAREQVRGQTQIGLAELGVTQTLGLAGIEADRQTGLATIGSNLQLGLANTAKETTLGAAAIGASVENTKQTSWTDLLKGVLGFGGSNSVLQAGGSLSLNQSGSGITISSVAPPAPPPPPPSTKPKYLSSEIRSFVLGEQARGVPINAVTINQWASQYGVSVNEVGAAFGFDPAGTQAWLAANPGVTNAVNTTGTGQSSQGGTGSTT